MGVKIPSPFGREVTASEPVSHREGPVHEPGPPRPVELLDPSRPAMIGILDAIGFGAARWFMPELQIYADYSDWLDMREGAQIGLAMAGVDARIVPVDFQRFISWCGDCRVDLTESALDVYAGMVAEPPPSVRRRP